MAGSDAEAVTNRAAPRPGCRSGSSARSRSSGAAGRSTWAVVKARALIARLLIDRGLIVSVDRLVDSLWGDHDGRGSRDRAALHHLAVAQTPARGGRPRGPDRDARPGLRRSRSPRRRPTSSRSNRWSPTAGVSSADAARARRCGCSTKRRASGAASAYSEVRDEPFARAEARRLEEMLLAAIETAHRRRLDPGPPRVADRRAGDADDRAPDARAPVVAAHARALPLGAPGRGAARLPGPSFHPRAPSSGSSPGTTCRGWSTPSSRRSPRSRSSAPPDEPATGAPDAAEDSDGRCRRLLDRLPRPHPDFTERGTARRTRP